MFITRTASDPSIQKLFLMRRIQQILLAAFLLNFLNASGQSRIRKAVFIIVDGIPADVIERVPHPYLDAIGKAGGYCRAYQGGIKGTYSQSPTISAVGYNNILTGTWADKHNVWDNDIKAPDYHYPSVFRLFKDRYPAKKIAVFSSWLDNRTKLVGDNLAATGHIHVDYKTDSLEFDTTDFPHTAQDYMQAIDDSVANAAARCLRDDAPDLSWVYLEYTDDIGHAYGDSPQMDQAVKNTDRRIGKIWDAVKLREKQYPEDWLVIVTTDHGRDSITGKEHGGQSQRERTGWIYTNAQGLNKAFTAPACAAVDIMPTICRFLDVAIPKEYAYEIDGTPLIGELSFQGLTLAQSDSGLCLKWSAVQSGGNLKVYMSSTDNFKTGGKDSYKLLKTVPPGQQGCKIRGVDMTRAHKFVVVGAYNLSNIQYDPIGAHHQSAP